MILKAPAKLNIGLNITGVRSDGYHLLDTVMQTIDICDEIIIEARDDNDIYIHCDTEGIPLDEHNLIYKAIRLLTDKGFDVTLRKMIPSQAGMGGGSSDAAQTLIAVNSMLNLGMTTEELESAAVKLGADVPFFIRGGRQHCMGIGEILRPLDHKDEYYVVIKPDVSISTKEVYDGYDRLHPELSDDLTNVLEAVTAEKHPIINEIKKKIKDCGAVAASMTGSGTAVYGIFDSREKAEACANKLGGRLCQSY